MSSESRPVERVAREVPGVVDTIGLAFGLLNRRPYLVWVVALADVLLWSGIDIRFRQWADFDWLPQSIASDMGSIGLTTVAASLMPTLFDTLAIRGTETGSFLESIRHVDGVAGTFLLVSAVVLSVLIAMLNLVVMTRLVRDEPVTVNDIVRLPIVTTCKMFGSIVLVILLILFLMSPFVGVGLGLEKLGVLANALIVWAGILLGGWLGMFFIFTGAGLVSGEMGIKSALQRSYQVVLQNILGLLGLMLIVLLIRLGLPFALSPFVESNWSIPFAIVVNAYVAAGLTASFVLFFQIRAQLLEPVAVSGTPSD